MTIDERLENLTRTVELLAQAQVQAEERQARADERQAKAEERQAKAEERQARIDERLEALTHSVELIADMQAKTEKELRRLGRFIRTIVIDHESRLLDLEGEDDKDDDEPHR